MSRRGESIYKRKDGRWEARYVKEIKADGKKIYGSVYAASYKEVKEKRQAVESNIKRPDNRQKELKINDVAGEWLYFTRLRVKPSSYQKYECLYRNHISSKIGTLKITEVSRNAVEKFTAECIENGLSVKSVNDILVILGMIFDFAKKEYAAQMPEVLPIKEERKEARVLSVEEQQRLIAYLQLKMSIYEFGMLLTLVTGLRIGELCALEWADIKDDCISVTKTMQRLKKEEGGTQIVIGTPKSESSKRIIPLPNVILPYIKKFRQAEGYVLGNEKCIRPEPRILQQHFKRTAKKCGLEKVTFHTLRHTFATRCIEIGFDVKTLSEILGHTDVKTTLNRYVHSSFELKRYNMEKLSPVFEI